MASQEGNKQWGGAVFLEEKQDHLLVRPQDGYQGEAFRVDTIQISCKSDPYESKKSDYGGIIIYGRDGKGEWHTKNGTKGKSGFVVIMQTNADKFEKLKKKWWNEPGQVHGIIYREALGESCTNVTVVGEGFSIMGGKFKPNSLVLNSSQGDHHHDNSREMNSVSAKCVKKVVEDWKRAGRNFRAQDYQVKSLLSPDNN